ncbi:uncharacterized protein A1O5_04775 [Cladophialophora psammophila CBS 110553]|uniref:Myb-like DNA-binding domain-containing protein n=1 Tax=Cladophialophora psammophila CBS 110553 TaxID=1182543 RepID=W9X5S4_9EURO|nr:uncharacterized protein A1O5_04775 [Cladophialophora psammophila CBS 110553]EXJ72271.1 hypothetical protein A1O5_04775 [Cladophialophora psammophila CBS 110553]
MAPRGAAAASGAPDPAFKFILSVLKHSEQVKPDWNAVAKENGIAYARNATARFKTIIENNGLKFENGSITVPDGVGGGIGLATAGAGAGAVGNAADGGDDESKTPKSAKQTPRKRKASAEDGDDTTARGSAKKGSPKKKMKSEPFVKVEQDAGEAGEMALAKAACDAANADVKDASSVEQAIKSEDRA